MLNEEEPAMANINNRLCVPMYLQDAGMVEETWQDFESLLKYFESLPPPTLLRRKASGGIGAEIPVHGLPGDLEAPCRRALRDASLHKPHNPFTQV